MKINLQEYIKAAYEGHLSEFAADAGMTKQLLDRKINMNCTIDTTNGLISRCQVKHACEKWVRK